MTIPVNEMKPSLLTPVHVRNARGGGEGRHSRKMMTASWGVKGGREGLATVAATAGGMRTGVFVRVGGGWVR